MILRFFLWASLTVLVAIPAWVYVSFAGGATIYEAGSLTPGHGGVAVAMVLLLVGLVKLLLNRESRTPITLAQWGLAIIVITTLATALLY